VDLEHQASVLGVGGSSPSGRAMKGNDMTREKILSVTAADCELQTFRAGGSGGQNQNKRDTGVRWIHPPSGARGESREERSQLQNKKAAWKRMVSTPEFQSWLRVQLGRDAEVAAKVERELWPDRLKTEVFEDGEWKSA
jgi:protein subunit release factor A